MPNYRNYRSRTFLFSRNEWEPEGALVMPELEELKDPLFDEGLHRIMDDYVPQHNKVIFSLCASTRPYIKSVRWKYYDECFGDQCDLVICSGGGIIPMEYMGCYPFLDYDVESEHATDKLYMEVFERRITEFLGKFSKYWDKICFVFIPTSRNYLSVEKNLNIPNSKLLPTRETYAKVLKGEDLYIGLVTKRYPIVAYSVLKEMDDYLETHSKRLQEIYNDYSNRKGLNMSVYDVIDYVHNEIKENERYTMEQLLDIANKKSEKYQPGYLKSVIIKYTQIEDENEKKFLEEDGYYYKFNKGEEVITQKPYRSLF